MPETLLDKVKRLRAAEDEFLAATRSALHGGNSPKLEAERAVLRQRYVAAYFDAENMRKGIEAGN